jgi:hypothetical protein
MALFLVRADLVEHLYGERLSLKSHTGDSRSIPRRCPPSELAFLRGFKARGLDEFREGGF